MLPQEKKTIKIDVDGSDAVSNVLLDLINTFPGLGDTKVAFSSLNEFAGIGFFPTSGPVIVTESEDICGHVTQMCQYPFDIVYRAAPKTEEHRIKIKEFLDSIGKWLEKQPIKIGDKEEKISEYPNLTAGDRVIKSISRTNTGHLAAAYQDGIEDWTISAALKYENEFDKE